MQGQSQQQVVAAPGSSRDGPATLAGTPTALQALTRNMDRPVQLA